MTVPTSENLFDRLLRSGTPLVADGAMGTSLFALGLESGGCPELLNVEQPDLIAKVHRAFVEAGSDIILTNTFGGNTRRLALHGLEHRVDELNTAAVAIAREVADEAGRSVVVAGSIGPTGDLYEPLGPLDVATAGEVFRTQALALVAAGVDVLWIETLSSKEELFAAVEACSGLGVPVTATLSFDTHGKTMMGIAPAEVGEWATELGLAAVGANCGIGPGDVIAAALELREHAGGIPVIAKANCGIPLYGEGELVYPSEPSTMSDYADLALRAGARIVGACCGSTGDHIAVLRDVVDGHDGGATTRDEIVRRYQLTRPERTTRRRRNRRAS